MKNEWTEKIEEQDELILILKAANKAKDELIASYMDDLATEKEEKDRIIRETFQEIKGLRRTIRRNIANTKRAINHYEGRE